MLANYKTFKVRGTSIVIIITSYWYCNLIRLPKSPDDFASDVLLMINWSMADRLINDWSMSSMDTPSCHYHINDTDQWLINVCLFVLSLFWIKLFQYISTGLPRAPWLRRFWAPGRKLMGVVATPLWRTRVKWVKHDNSKMYYLHYFEDIKRTYITQ